MHRLHRRISISGIAALAALPALVPPGPAAAQSPRVVAVVDSLATAAVRAGEVAGAVVAVARRGDAPVSYAYGLADVENDVRMTSEHIFPIASVTKQFTAAAVLRLVEQGKVVLDEPITTYLPGAPTQRHRVTVRQLLAHTSGMADVTEAPRFRSVERLDLAPDSTLSLVREEPFYFPPGEQMRYSNSGYLLLGQLIEAVSGRSYADYLVEELFRPAGMKSSRYCDQRALIPRRASGYEFTAEGLVRSRFVSLRIPFSAGGICSTAADLVAWNRALHGGRVLAPATYAEMMRPGVLADGRQTRYGLGLALGEIAGRRVVHHGGDIQGFTSYSMYFPADSLSVVVLFNTQGPTRPDALAERIAEAALGGPPTPQTAATAPDLRPFVGEYGDGVKVALAADGLRLSGSPHGDATLHFVGGTTFTDGQALYTFQMGEGRGAALWADLVWALVRWDRKRP